MLTRRVRGRTFLLRPSRRTNQLVRYVVAVMGRKWRMKLHAITVLSNHVHLCVTDPEGNVVDFQRDCHSFIARALNARHAEFESVWSSGGTSRVECEEPEDLIGKIAYTMANPVEAGLVRHGASWPGVRHAWPCRPRVIRKPSWFFRGPEDGGVWPETIELEFSRPPGYDELSDDELAAVIAAAIEQREEHFRLERDRAGQRFLGRKRVLTQRRHECPSSREPRFGLSPKLACRNKWRRIERLAANKRWLALYNDARRRWAAGERDVVFPAGTYKMRVQHGAICAASFG
jgi:putative transposase